MHLYASFCSAEDQTQGFMYARQACLQLNYILTSEFPFNGRRWLLVKVIVAIRSCNTKQVEPSSQGSQHLLIV